MKCMEQNLAADAPDEEKYEPNHDYVGADEEVSCSEVETLAGSVSVYYKPKVLC